LITHLPQHKLLLFDSKQRVKTHTHITGVLQFQKHLTEFSENIF